MDAASTSVDKSANPNEKSHIDWLSDVEYNDWNLVGQIFMETNIWHINIPLRTAIEVRILFAGFGDNRPVQ
jgi:hypothetical protein